MTEYVLAADGGNSKTDLVLACLDGTVRCRVTGPGTRPSREGTATTARGLAALAKRAVSDAGLPAGAEIALGSFYLANVDVPEEEQAMLAALTPFGIASRLEVRNDTFAVLLAGSRNGWGIAVVSGAGINAVGRHPDGREERFLGIGSTSGDWGGGLAVGKAALGAAVRAGDGRGPATVLREVVSAAFDLPPEAAALAADRGEITQQQLIHLAPAVFGAASGGDAVAARIVHRLADEVLDFVAALVRRMGVAGSEVDVVLGGGTLQSGHRLLLDRIDAGVARLAPRARLRMLEVPPVAGALVSALTGVGAHPDAVSAAREAFRR